MALQLHPSTESTLIHESPVLGTPIQATVLTTKPLYQMDSLTHSAQNSICRIFCRRDMKYHTMSSEIPNYNCVPNVFRNTQNNRKGCFTFQISIIWPINYGNIYICLQVHGFLNAPLNRSLKITNGCFKQRDCPDKCTGGKINSLPTVHGQNTICSH